MPDGTRGTILLVDDSPIQRRLYSDILSVQGYAVYPAANFHEAEQFLLGTWPTAILLDVMMEGVDGIEACRRFRRRLGDRVPILFFTSEDTIATVVAALQAGGDDYVVKTGSPTILLERLAHWHRVNLPDLPERRAKAIAYLQARINPGAAPSREEPGDRHRPSNTVSRKH